MEYVINYIHHTTSVTPVALVALVTVAKYEQDLKEVKVQPLTKLNEDGH